MTPDQEVESTLMGPRVCWAPGGVAACDGATKIDHWQWKSQAPNRRYAFRLNFGHGGDQIDCPVCKPLYLKQLYRK